MWSAMHHFVLCAMWCCDAAVQVLNVGSLACDLFKFLGHRQTPQTSIGGAIRTVTEVSASGDDL